MTWQWFDALWPTLDGDEPAGDEARELVEKQRKRIAAIGTDDALAAVLDELRLANKEEDDRRAHVEGKAAGLLAAVGLAVSLGSGVLFAAAHAEFSDRAVKTVAVIAVCFGLVAMVYMCGAARQALQALMPRSVASVGPEDILANVCLGASDVRRRVAIEYAKCAILNRAGTNAKLDHVSLAQSFVRNALFALLAVAVLSVVAFIVVPVKTPAAVCPPPASGSPRPQRAPGATDAHSQPPRAASARTGATAANAGALALPAGAIPVLAGPQASATVQDAGSAADNAP